MEEWKDIVGYEGLYQVSNLGRVKSLERPRFERNKYTGARVPEKILKSKLVSRYFRIGLTKEGEQKYHLVSRLVALTFIPNPGNKPEVNHKDGIKANNRADNLEWVTAKENMDHARRIGLV